MLIDGFSPFFSLPYDVSSPSSLVFFRVSVFSVWYDYDVMFGVVRVSDFRWNEAAWILCLANESFRSVRFHWCDWTGNKIWNRSLSSFDMDEGDKTNPWCQQRIQHKIMSYIKKINLKIQTQNVEAKYYFLFKMRRIDWSIHWYDPIRNIREEAAAEQNE